MTVTHASARASDVRVISLLSLAHGSSHFFHLILPPLFPWLKAEFALSYAELGLLMSVFFVVSCIVQAASGFLVDRIGARPVLFVGVGLLALSAVVLSQSNGYALLMLGAVIAGCGNGVFHPVDYTLINHKVSVPRLPYAYSAHGVTGYLGWAVAPVFMAGIAALADWRIALLCAAVLEALILLVLWFNRGDLIDDAQHRRASAIKAAEEANPGRAPQSAFAFLKLTSVWLCWLFFFFSMIAMAGIQSFAPSALNQLYGIPVTAGNFSITLMALGSAAGMIVGGIMAAKLKMPDRIVGTCLFACAVIGLLIGAEFVTAAVVPGLFFMIGCGLGIAAPSRDMMIRSATPQGVSGSVYGIVYSGIDLGAAVGPLLFGILLDAGKPNSLFLGVAFLQLLLILTAVKVVASNANAAMPKTQ
jgi:FSR family fosmidomycin resistance protein-like MFS transporter